MKKTRKLILVIAALGLIAGPASSLEAHRHVKKESSKKESPKKHRKSNGRGARVGGALLGAGAGGGIAVGVGSAKWAALGIPVGGLAGYFLVRAIQKGRRNRENRRDQQNMKRERNKR